MELVKWNNARKAIAECKTVDEVKEVRDKAEAMRVYSKQIGESLEVQNDCAEIKLRAERRAGEMLKEMEIKRGNIPGSNNREIVKLQDVTLQNIGIQKHESSRWQAISRIPEDTFETIIVETKEAAKELTESMMLKVEKEIQKEEKKQNKIEQYEKVANQFDSEDIKINNIDFREYAKQIDNNFIDAIITDPPYPEEYLDLWQDLFIIAEKILKPSSFLIAYSGQMYLDKIFNMKNNLIYYWMMNIIFSQKPLIQGRNIINEWKPILIFQKPPFKKISDTISDTISFNYDERDLHDKNWGQTIKPFELLIERFTNPGDLILEPFAGSGTTLIAAQRQKRKCIGCEIDKQYIEIIKGRLFEG